MAGLESARMFVMATKKYYDQSNANAHQEPERHAKVQMSVGQVGGTAPTPNNGLPADAAARKTYPIHSGVIAYFPDALAEVAHVSHVGNLQHNPGQPLHWAKEKSQDELDALARHLSHAEEVDSDGLLHAAKVAWRALAFLQKLVEARRMGYTMAQYNAYLRSMAMKTPGRPHFEGLPGTDAEQLP